jgi:hypothetical protein
MPTPNPYAMPESSMNDASIEVQRSPRHLLWFAFAAVLDAGSAYQA